MTGSPAEIMRFTAPDAQALERSIAEVSAKLAEAQARGDEVAVVDCAADLGSMLTTARNEAAAVKLLIEHQGLAETHAQIEPAAWFWNALATALQYVGKRERAEGCFAKALAAAQQGGWKRLEALVLHHWGRSLAEQGRLPEAESRIAQALAIRQALGDPRQDSSRKALIELARLAASQQASRHATRE